MQLLPGALAAQRWGPGNRKWSQSSRWLHWRLAPQSWVLQLLICCVEAPWTLPRPLNPQAGAAGWGPCNFVLHMVSGMQCVCAPAAPPLSFNSCVVLDSSPGCWLEASSLFSPAAAGGQLQHGSTSGAWEPEALVTATLAALPAAGGRSPLHAVAEVAGQPAAQLLSPSAASVLLEQTPADHVEADGSQTSPAGTAVPLLEQPSSSASTAVAPATLAVQPGLVAAGGVATGSSPSAAEPSAPAHQEPPSPQAHMDR